MLLCSTHTHCPKSFDHGTKENKLGRKMANGKKGRFMNIAALLNTFEVCNFQN